MDSSENDPRRLRIEVPLLRMMATALGTVRLARVLSLIAEQMRDDVPPDGGLDDAGWRRTGIGDLLAEDGVLKGSGAICPSTLRWTNGHYLVSSHAGAVPETVAAALVGRPMGDLIRHRQVDPHQTIRAVRTFGTGTAIWVDRPDMPMREAVEMVARCAAMPAPLPDFG